MKKARFEPGETAILHTNNGGRIFIVHECTEDGVIERHTFEGQQKYASLTPHNRLTKVHSAERAHELVGRFLQIAAERERTIREAEQKARVALENTLYEYDAEAE